MELSVRFIKLGSGPIGPFADSSQYLCLTLLADKDMWLQEMRCLFKPASFVADYSVLNL